MTINPYPLSRLKSADRRSCRSHGVIAATIPVCVHCALVIWKQAGIFCAV